VDRRPSSWRWASAASARGNSPPTRTFNSPEATYPSTSPTRHSSSSRLAVWPQDWAASRMMTPKGARGYWGHRPAGLSVQSQASPAGQTVDAFLKGDLAHGVVNSLATPATGGCVHDFLKVLKSIVDGILCTISRGFLPTRPQPSERRSSP